jgi:hypothetical protein
MADVIFGPLFRVPKATGTHADALLAVGLADLLREAAVDGSPRLEDGGADFYVRLTRPIGRSNLARITPHAGYDYLCPNANSRRTVPAGTKAVDYVDEKARGERYREARRDMREMGKPEAEILQALQHDRPRGDWPQLQALNALQGDDASNRAHVSISRLQPDEFVGMVAQGLDSVANATSSGIDLRASAVQLFSPVAAKGYARLKPDSTHRGDKTVTAWADDFREWLKYRGYFRVACPRFLKNDVRLLVPAPADISVESLSRLARELLALPLGRAESQIDTLAVLALARLLVRHSREYQAADSDPLPDIFLEGRTPASLVQGIYVTHYQSMGSAKAVAQMSLLALPGWFTIETPADALDWIAILDEHSLILRRLKPDHGDEVALVGSYRNFLQSRDAVASARFLAFLAEYGSFLMRARASGRKISGFRSDHVRRILMGVEQPLSSIFDDLGFVAVADAVRRATVSAQSLKSMGKDHREIRYGLLAELRRTQNLPAEAFVRCVSDFVSKYNAENARRQEMSKDPPRRITTDEMAALVRLADRHGAPLVGSPLAAYASCRKPDERQARESAATETPESDKVEADVDGDDAEE